MENVIEQSMNDCEECSNLEGEDFTNKLQKARENLSKIKRDDKTDKFIDVQLLRFDILERMKK